MMQAQRDAMMETLIEYLRTSGMLEKLIAMLNEIHTRIDRVLDQDFGADVKKLCQLSQVQNASEDEVMTIQAIKT